MIEEFPAFFERALLFGHNSSKLLMGEQETTYILMESAHEVRKYMSVASQEQRIRRQKSFYNPGIKIRQRLGQGIHDRGEAFVFADEPIHPEDSQGLANHFPAHGKLLSIYRKKVEAGQTWDLTVSAEQWGIDPSEELYTAVNIGELILEPGAKVIIQGNVFSLVCQKLLSFNLHSSNPKHYQIGILPTPFSLDTRRGFENGRSGTSGKHGKHGKSGIHPIVQNSLIGKYSTDPINPESLHGEDGEDGTAGEDGGDGRNGGMSKIAEITINKLMGDLQIFSQAGKGGNGGDGGDGGNGGDGGDGADGVKLINGLVSGGKPGNGGKAGNGGNGGNAANGGLSSNIYINVPKDQEHHVSCNSLPSEPGIPGKAGKSGIPGIQGNPGEFHKDFLKQTVGQVKDGKGGRSGKSRLAPWIFLNEIPVAPLTIRDAASSLSNQNFTEAHFYQE